jgi:DNA-binding winged helix-turn-helix (wHTH) protein/TolB-like protein
LKDICLGTRILQPRRQLIADGERVPLGRRALDIISVLAEAHGGIVTKAELFEAVWPDVVVEENALQVHIVALRKALGPEADRLKTIRGVGYQLDVEDGRAIAPTVPSNKTAPVVQANGDGTVRNVRSGPRVIRIVPRRFRPALIVVSLLVVLLAASWLVAPDLRLRPHDRIPVVVHPLATSGDGDPTERALAGGITGELIDRLRRVPELRVAITETGGQVPNDTFRNAHFVDGSLRRSGDQLRVMIRLSDAKGEIVWSQIFDRKLVELLDMQEQIASAIGNALSVSLDVGADSRQFGGTSNPDAYAAYLQFGAHQLDPDQSVPLQYLNRALELDPHYVKALGALSTSYGFRANSASSRKEAEDFLSKMDASTRQEIATAPDLWIGYESRAWYYANRRDPLASQQSFEKAIRHNKANDYEPQGNFAAFEAQTGRFSAARSRLAALSLIDPAAKEDGVYIWIALWSGRYQEAIDRFDRIAATQSGNLPGLANYAAWARLLLNGEADAIKFSRENGGTLEQSLQNYRAEDAIVSMRPAQLKDWAAKKYGDGGHVSLASLSLWAGYYHHPQLALELLRLSQDRLGGFAATVAWYPQMAEMRRMSGFKELVEREGLVKLWRATGDWGEFCKPTTGDDFTCR